MSPNPDTALLPIATAPRDGSPFKAVLVDDNESVTVRYSTSHADWLREDRWYDDNGDGAPDGSCRTWEADDFLGWQS